MVDTLEDITPQDFWDLAPVLPDDFNDNEIITIPKAVNISSTVENKESGEKGKEGFPYTNFLITEADNQSSIGMKGKKQLIQGLEEENHPNLRVEEMECSWPHIKEKKQSNIDFQERKDAHCKADKEEMGNQGVRKKIKSSRRRSSASGKKQKLANCEMNEKHSSRENKDGKPSSQLLREDHQRNETYQTCQGINDQLYFNGERNTMHQPVVSNVNSIIELYFIPVPRPRGKHGRSRHQSKQFICFYICRPVDCRERVRISRLPRAWNMNDTLLLFVFCFIFVLYSMIM